MGELVRTSDKACRSSVMSWGARHRRYVAGRIVPTSMVGTVGELTTVEREYIATYNAFATLRPSSQELCTVARFFR